MHCEGTPSAGLVSCRGATIGRSGAVTACSCGCGWDVNSVDLSDAVAGVSFALPFEGSYCPQLLLG